MKKFEKDVAAFRKHHVENLRKKIDTSLEKFEQAHQKFFEALSPALARSPAAHKKKIDAPSPLALDASAGEARADSQTSVQDKLFSRLAASGETFERKVHSATKFTFDVEKGKWVSRARRNFFFFFFW